MLSMACPVARSSEIDEAQHTTNRPLNPMLGWLIMVTGIFYVKWFPY